MNKNQKITAIVAIVIIIGIVSVWLYTGGEILSKSQVLIEKQDLLFGTTYNEWQDKFVLGLDYTAVVSVVVAVFSGILIYLFKNKRKENV